MSQPRQFEGPDVRQLLDDIRDAYGGDEPTIARAETYRTGGVLGFFQREQYRLTVDPALPPPRIRTHSSSDSAASFPAPGIHGGSGLRPALVARTPAMMQAALGTSSRPGLVDEGPVAESDFFALLADTTLDSNFVSTTPAAAPFPDREPVAAGPSANPDPAPIAAPQIDAHPTAALASPQPVLAAGGPEPLAAAGGSEPQPGAGIPEAAPVAGASVASFDSILERLATILENSKDDGAPEPPAVDGPSKVDLPPWMTAEADHETAQLDATLARLKEEAAALEEEEAAAREQQIEPDDASDLGQREFEPLVAADNGHIASFEPNGAENGSTQPEPASEPLSSATHTHSEGTNGAVANVPGGTNGADEALWWATVNPMEEATVTEPSVSSYPSKENGPVSGINPFSGPTPFRAPAQAPFGRATLTREPSARVEEVQGNEAALPTDTPLGQALLRTGLSPEVAAHVVHNVDAGLELPTALSDALLGLPRAPALPRQARALIVVAGPGRAAIALANDTATEVGTDVGDVLVASTDAACPVPADRRIRSAQDASALAPGYRRSGVAVVAVDVAAGGGSQAWAAEVIGALRPTLVLGIIDAVHKTEDMAAWIDAIGGVDAVVIENPDATVSPASVLALPVPVARLGHQPASPGIWVSAILDRVGACG